jgi:DNA-binding transcriptional MerR regulator
MTSAHDDNKNAWRTIAEVSQEFGVTRRTLRFYEQHGLLLPLRGPGTLRRYSAANRERLAKILHRSRQDFTLAEITAWLDGHEFERTRLIAQIRHLEAELERINTSIVQLKAEINV